jgi:hypothetical protein
MVKVNWRFGEHITSTFKVSQARNQHEAGSKHSFYPRRQSSLSIYFIIYGLFNDAFSCLENIALNDNEFETIWKEGAVM